MTLKDARKTNRALKESVGKMVATSVVSVGSMYFLNVIEQGLRINSVHLFISTNNNESNSYRFT